MAVRYRNTRTGREVERADPDAVMDRSKRWERIAVGGVVGGPGARLVGDDFCVITPDAALDNAGAARTFDPATAFDPAGYNVAEVNAHLAMATAAERAQVLAAEAAGKARRGVLAGPYADG